MIGRRLTSRTFTPLNLHVTAVAVFLLLDLVLGTRLLLAWHRSGSDQTAQYNSDLLAYGQLQAKAARLQHLPQALQHSNREADRFFAARVAPSDSAVLADLGELTTRNHVRLSRATYGPRAALPGILELRIEANVSGQYTDIMHFINDMERDKDHAFFIIRSVVLTGQQGGLVDLRLRVDTYMRGEASGALLPAQGSGQEAQ